MKKIIQRALFIIFGGGLALAAPVIPQQMEWVVSYETIAFDTVDRDLSLNEYAINPEGGYYIREVPKDKGQFVATSSEDAIKGKQLVEITAMKNERNPDCTGCAYYSVFQTRKGELVRTAMDREPYKDLSRIKNAEQPKRAEAVSVIEGLQAEAAIALDNVSEDVTQNSVSSLSWSHTVTSNTNGLLYIGVNFSDRTTGENDNVTGITYNSDALTLIREDRSVSESTGIKVSLWHRLTPDTGANTVSVTFNATITTGGGGGISFTGVDQSDTINSSSTASYTDDTTVGTTVVTSGSGNAVVSALTTSHPVTGVWSPSGGSSLGWFDDGSTSEIHAAGSYWLNKSGSVAMNWSCSGCFGTDESVVTAVAFNEHSDPVAPTVTTNAASGISSTGATINGNITDDGAQSITQHGFAWGTNSSLSGGDTATTTLGAGAEGAFDDALSSLSNGTTYYFRAYAVNASGTSTGSILSFVAQDSVAAGCEYVTSNTSTSDLTTYTYASQSLGTAAADRHIVIVTGARKAGAGFTLSSVTVGGVSATIVEQVTHNVTNSNTTGIAIAAVPTGTTGDVVVTWSTGVLRNWISVYRLDNLDDPTSPLTATDTGANPSGAINTTEGDCALGGATSAAGATTWSGITEDVDTTLETFVQYTSAHLSISSPSTPLTMTATMAGSGSGETAGAFAVWTGAAAPPAPETPTERRRNQVISYVDFYDARRWLSMLY